MTGGWQNRLKDMSLSKLGHSEGQGSWGACRPLVQELDMTDGLNNNNILFAK